MIWVKKVKKKYEVNDDDDEFGSDMTLSCNIIVNVPYLTVSKRNSDHCSCSLPEQSITLNDLYIGLMILFKKMTKI